MKPSLFLLCIVTHVELYTSYEDRSIDFLKQFGYIDSNLVVPQRKSKIASRRLSSSNSAIRTKKQLRQGIEQFQRYYGLPVTGEFDMRTREAMRRPRCGNVDIEVKPRTLITRQRAVRREKSSVNTGVQDKWSHTDITYKITEFPSKLSTEFSPMLIKAEIARAFALWASVTPLSFANSDEEADIELSFVDSYHGTCKPFDGPYNKYRQGNVLAHAFPPSDPTRGGQVHFEDKERFTINKTTTYAEVDLFIVAAHEIGHALGLKHSDDVTSLMAPAYPINTADFRLSASDVRNIQSLYGQLRSTNVDFCSIYSRLDAVTYQMIQGRLKLFAFQGEYFVEIEETLGVVGSHDTKLIADYWPKLSPGHVDAAVHHKRYTLFFKKSFIYVYTGNRKFVIRYTARHFNFQEDTKAACNCKQSFYTINGVGGKNMEAPVLPFDGVDAAYSRPDGTAVFFRHTKFYEFNTNFELIKSGLIWSWLGCGSMDPAIGT